MRYLIIALVVFNLLSVDANSQTGTIKGKVTTRDGEPAGQVNVIIGELKMGIVTPVTGEFLFKNIKPGIYTVIISYSGLQSQRRTVAVKATDTAAVDVTPF